MPKPLMIFIFVLFVFIPIQTNAETILKNISCSHEKAVYKPHPSYPNKKISFVMTIEKPAGKQTTENWFNYFVHAFLEGKEVSNYRMPLICGNGVVGCYLDGGKFLALDEKLHEITGSKAPNIYVLSKIPDFGGKEKSSNRITFLTKENIIPDFTGLNMWVLDSCNE